MRKLSYLALVGMVYNFLFPQYAWAAYLPSAEISQEAEYQLAGLPEEILPALQETAVIASDGMPSDELKNAAKSKFVVLTAYSSTPDQTDSSPFITASGTTVRDGIIASNLLPFGTLVKFPKLYGEKIFIVQDRLAPKNSHKIDIWFPSREEAKQFGVKITEVLILK